MNVDENEPAFENSKKVARKPTQRPQSAFVSLTQTQKNINKETNRNETEMKEHPSREGEESPINKDRNLTQQHEKRSNRYQDTHSKGLGFVDMAKMTGRPLSSVKTENYNKSMNLEIDL